MSSFPVTPDIFVDRTGSDAIASSDPNNAYDGIENIENFLGASGEAQSKSATLVNLFRAMLNPMLECSYISATTIAVEAGPVALFNGDNFVIKRNTAISTCILSSHLLNGSEAATTWYDLYVLGDGTNTNFTLGFLGQGTSAAAYATYYQKINSFYNDSASNLRKVYQQNDYMEWDVPILKSTNPSTASWSAALSCADAMPSMSRSAVFVVGGYDASNFLGFSLRPNGATGTTPATTGDGDIAGIGNLSGQVACLTDENQRIQYYGYVQGGAVTYFRIQIKGYYINI